MSRFPPGGTVPPWLAGYDNALEFPTLDQDRVAQKGFVSTGGPTGVSSAPFAPERWSLKSGALPGMWQRSGGRPRPAGACTGFQVWNSDHAAARNRESPRPVGAKSTGFRDVQAGIQCREKPAIAGTLEQGPGGMEEKKGGGRVVKTAGTRVTGMWGIFEGREVGPVRPSLSLAGRWRRIIFLKRSDLGAIAASAGSDFGGSPFGGRTGNDKRPG